MTTATATYSPRGVLIDAMNCRDPEVLVAGPAGTGKSLMALWKVHATALSNPGARCLLVRKTLVSLTSTALVTWKRDVIPSAIEAGVVEYYGGSRAEAAAYRYSNGARVELGGLDKATKIMSSEYDLIYVQEATELTEDDWEALSTRLRSGVVSYQQLLGDCNPDRPEHWLKKRADRGTVTLFESRHEDNPTLYDDTGTLTKHGEAYMGRLEKLTGTRYQRLRLGLWVGAEGVIYPEFDAAVHVIDRYDIPDDWQRWWTIDFGFVNAFVCQHWAEAPDGELIMYREFYGTRRLVSVWAQTILSAVTSNGCWIEPQPVAIICDHDAEGRATLEEEFGRGTVAAHKAVLDGIQAVQRRLTDRRLLFMRDSLVERDRALDDESKPACTVEEFGGYVWADGGKTKEQPVKIDDHGMDATRYLCSQRDLIGRPQIRWL